MTDNEKQPKNTKPSIEDGIGVRLKAARESKALSQSDLHTKTGLSRTVLINYEAGRHKPGSRELRLLCDALEVSPNHLIYGTENPHETSESLADSVLNLGGETAAASSIILMPFIAVALGKDDARTILNLIETLLKAKNPTAYSHLMNLTKMLSKYPGLSPEQIIAKGGDPEKLGAELQGFLTGAMEEIDLESK